MVNVFLTPDAYARLRAAKEEGESFSDVVVREVKQKIDLDKYIGSCAGMDVEKAIANIKKNRRHR